MTIKNSVHFTSVPKHYNEIKIAGIPASKLIKKLLQFNITTTAVAAVMIIIAAIMLHDPNYVVQTMGALSVGHCFFVGIPVSTKSYERSNEIALGYKLSILFHE